ncbi:FkbM family methyltransferase [Roseovarius sp. LXJ103]|uniref:FkbM family methyltransferase n=1 Tax=Roseovarius carneus TaxID=2853164 RepID=UPI000D61EE17|nr:FkbM family methyltransferase [Roseovarius carneus]MBZ8119741.1 FkbM family methyltransferase [Roseovarius carneus]PWE34653.1 FkbM family methyltransferase [Pelagicola sp. LXJ1103]
MFRIFKKRVCNALALQNTTQGAHRLTEHDKRQQLLSSPTGRLFSTLASLDFAPTHIVDIGANHGNWTRTARAAFPDANISAFEPQNMLADKHTDLARDPRIELHYKGVGDFDGTAPFTIHGRDDSSSFIYSASEAEGQGLTRGEVAICRLDTAMAESAFGAPDIVKIDAEGLDLNVCEGAPETLAQAQILLIEATVACPTYPNTANAVFAKMESLGYRLFDITDLNRLPENGVLWLIEAVFVRKGTQLDIASKAYD